MKSVQISVLASAVGIALVGAGLSPDLLANTQGTSANLAVAQAGAAATAVGRYIITFSEPGLVAYKGDVSGLQRTAPQTDNVSANSSRKFDAHSSAASAYRNYLASQRATHVAAIEQKLGHALVIRYTYDVTRNAISVQMSAREAALVMHVEGVSTVSAVTRLQPDTFRGPTFIGANTIWDGTGVPSYDSATRGQGVKVGVIDTGTNAAHPSFANDPACGFSLTHPKLHGRDCTSNDGTVCTGTSPDAPDGQGHGVHTSSTAAGNTIDNTFTPPPLLPDGVSMSGVAPCADVYAYRVAENDGSLTNDAITAAIQNAIVDQVDVINFSIGPTCGGGNPWDDSLDFLAAEGADIFVAASAGNTRSTCTNPTGLVANNGPWMMTVAASSQDEVAAPVLTATGPGTPPPLTQNVALIAGNTTLPASSTVNLTGAHLRTYPTNPIGCTATGVFPAGYFGGAIAILRRGTCSFTEKITNAYNAGARTVVIVNNQPGSISMNTTGAPADVAAFSTYKAAGDALIAFVDANLGPIPAADAVFADGFELPLGAIGNYNTIGIGQVPGDILAAFSFRGPTQAPYDNLTKPDITGPGVNIYAAVDTASGSYGLESGTSMSSPHLAGSAALVRAVQPNWSPMEIKSAIQTTAKLDGLRQDEVTPWNADDVGSGRVDLSKATRAGVTLDESPDNFTAANPSGGTIDMRTLNLASLRDTSCNAGCSWTRRFTNRLNVSGTWTPTAVDPPGYHLTFSPASITMGPGFSKSITITATATGTPPAVLGFGRVDLTESGNHSPVQHLTVAVKAAPPVISVTPASLTSTQDPNTTTTAPITVANTGGGTLNWSLGTTGPGVVWNQPITVNSGLPSTYSTADVAGAWLAADFQVATAGPLTKLTVFGFDNTNTLATKSIKWAIYGDAAGLPNGNPNDGSGTAPVWTYTALGNSTGVTITGSGVIALDLAAAGQTVNLPAGTYWLSVIPTYPDPFPATGTSTSGPWNWATSAKVLNDAVAVGDEFGFAAWTTYTNFPGLPANIRDVAFKIDGTITCGAPWLAIAPTSGSNAGGTNTPGTATFNSTGLAAGTYTATACFASNDPATPLVTVPVSLTVNTVGSTCTPTQLFQDTGFEATAPDFSNAFWASTSTNGGTSLCDASCGGSGMNAGSYWAWMGGWGTAVETGTVSQSVVIPTGSPRFINFYLRRTATTSNAALTVNIDGVTAATFPGVATSEAAYVQRSVPVPAGAVNGASHAIEIKYTKTDALNGGSMHVDDVTLDCAAAPALPGRIAPVADALRSIH